MTTGTARGSELGTARRAGGSRRWLAGRAAWLAALGPAALGTACSGPGTGAGTPGSPALDLKGVTIEHWVANALTHPEGMAKEKVMQTFSAQSGQGVTVTSSGSNGPDKIIAALTAGTPPDLVDGFHFNMSSLFRQGGLVDVESELKTNADWKKAKTGLSPEILTGGFTWTGKVYGVPYYSSHFAMYYQPELLKRAGLTAPPPKSWTWDQFVDYQRGRRRRRT